jgi:inward rectifier potassium channel
MFRIANARRGQLFDVSVRVVFSWLEGEGIASRRRFETLGLERRRVTFFPLHWTVVHPMNTDSPLYDWTRGRDRVGCEVRRHS